MVKCFYCDKEIARKKYLVYLGSHYHQSCSNKKFKRRKVFPFGRGRF